MSEFARSARALIGTRIRLDMGTEGRTSYPTIKQTGGFAYLAQVHDEKRGKKVIQVFENFIAKLGRLDEATAKELGLPIPKNPTIEAAKDKVKRPHWNTLRPKVYARDKGICWVCHKFVPLDDYQLGHLVDRGNGGYSDYNNVAVMHSNCNYHKPRHNTINEHIEWLLKTRFLADKASLKPKPTTPTQG